MELAKVEKLWKELDPVLLQWRTSTNTKSTADNRNSDNNNDKKNNKNNKTISSTSTTTTTKNENNISSSNDNNNNKAAHRPTTLQLYQIGCVLVSLINQQQQCQKGSIAAAVALTATVSSSSSSSLMKRIMESIQNVRTGLHEVIQCLSIHDRSIIVQQLWIAWSWSLSTTSSSVSGQTDMRMINDNNNNANCSTAVGNSYPEDNSLRVIVELYRSSTCFAESTIWWDDITTTATTRIDHDSDYAPSSAYLSSSSPTTLLSRLLLIYTTTNATSTTTTTITSSGSITNLSYPSSSSLYISPEQQQQGIIMMEDVLLLLSQWLFIHPDIEWDILLSAIGQLQEHYFLSSSYSSSSSVATTTVWNDLLRYMNEHFPGWIELIMEKYRDYADYLEGLLVPQTTAAATTITPLGIELDQKHNLSKDDDSALLLLSVTAAEESIQHKIDQVQQIIPDLGEGYIETVLSYFQGHVERTIEALLIENRSILLPLYIRVMDEQLPRRRRYRQPIIGSMEHQQEENEAKQRTKIALQDMIQQQEQEAYYIEQVMRHGAHDEYNDDYDDQYDNLGEEGDTTTSTTTTMSGRKAGTTIATSSTNTKTTTGIIQDGGLYDDYDAIRTYNRTLKQIEADQLFWEENRNTNRIHHANSNNNNRKNNEEEEGNDNDDGNEGKVYRGPDKGRGGRIPYATNRGGRGGRATTTTSTTAAGGGERGGRRGRGGRQQAARGSGGRGGGGTIPAVGNAGVATAAGGATTTNNNHNNNNNNNGTLNPRAKARTLAKRRAQQKQADIKRSGA